MYDFEANEYVEMILQRFIFTIITIVFIVLIALFIIIPMRWYFKSVLGDKSKNEEENETDKTKEGGS